MERGAILLLDEIDLASNKIMCLQPILEGNGVFIKKINKFVKPAPGFNVIATANTKGQGSDDGKFIGTNILNEAFLERFPITVEQSYPTNKNETKILENVMTEKGLTRQVDKKFAENLITWADIIRKTFYEGGVDEIISTRRLVHIVDAYAIFKDKMKSIQMCTNRFDTDTKNSFIDLYTKIDGGEDVSTWLNTPDTEEQDSDTDEEGNVNY
jgi:cobaltochelatase CobS